MSTPEPVTAPALPPELSMFLDFIGLGDMSTPLCWEDLDVVALQPIARWRLAAEALEIEDDRSPDTAYLRRMARLTEYVCDTFGPFFDLTSGAHPTGIALAEVMVKGVAERLTQHTAAVGRLATVIAEGSKVLREALLPTHPELAQQEDDDKAAGKSRLLRLATLAAQALGSPVQEQSANRLATARWFALCEAFGFDPEQDPPVSIPAILADERWTDAVKVALSDACSRSRSLEVILGELVQMLVKVRAFPVLVMGPDPAHLRNVDPDKVMAALSTPLEKRQTESMKANNDQKQVLTGEPNLLVQAEQRAGAAEHALQSLGWPGVGDPIQWAQAQRDKTAIPTVGRMRQLEADLEVLGAETTRLTERRDALHNERRAMLERLGWRTGMDPDAVISQATFSMQQMEDIKREFAAHPRLRVEGASVAGQVHDLLELLDRAGPGEDGGLRAVADKLAADTDARHRERMDADAKRARERTQQKQQARRWVDLCKTLGWPQHVDPPTSLAGFVDDRGHRGAFIRVAVAGYLAGHYQLGCSLGEVLERMVADLTIRRDEQIQKQPGYLLEQAQAILQKIREQAGNQEDTWSATLHRVRGLASIVGSLAALQASADNPTAASIEIDMSQVDLAGVNARMVADMRSLANYRIGTLPAIQAIAHAGEDKERMRLSAFILRHAAGTKTADQLAAYDLEELRQVAQALAEGLPT